MSTSTIESVETFLLDYGHKERHCILNNQSSFDWDCQGTTGTLKGVLKCDGSGIVEVGMTQVDEETWIGDYDDDQAWTLTISGFTHYPSTGRIVGDIQRSHPKEDYIGSDDMGSFTGTKT